MKPSGQKKHLIIDEIYTRYYEYEVFRNPDHTNLVFQILSKETENDAIHIEKEALAEEILALRLELFSLALSKVELFFNEEWSQATFDSAIDNVFRGW